jgi:hypothetical protein
MVLTGSQMIPGALNGYNIGEINQNNGVGLYERSYRTPFSLITRLTLHANLTKSCILTASDLVVASLNHFKTRFKTTEECIEALPRHTSLVADTLKDAQQFFSDNPQAIISKLESRYRPLLKAYDTALIGVVSLLSFLYYDIQALNEKKHLPGWISRARVGWNYELMNDVRCKLMKREYILKTLLRCFQT